MELRRSQIGKTWGRGVRHREWSPCVYYTFFPLTFKPIMPVAYAGQTTGHGPNPSTSEYTYNIVSTQKSYARKEEF